MICKVPVKVHASLMQRIMICMDYRSININRNASVIHRQFLRLCSRDLLNAEKNVSLGTWMVLNKGGLKSLRNTEPEVWFGFNS